MLGIADRSKRKREEEENPSILSFSRSSDEVPEAAVIIELATGNISFKYLPKRILKADGKTASKFETMIQGCKPNTKLF